jgi:hypothetical protein
LHFLPDPGVIFTLINISKRYQPGIIGPINEQTLIIAMLSKALIYANIIYLLEVRGTTVFSGLNPSTIRGLRTWLTSTYEHTVFAKPSHFWRATTGNGAS